MYELEQKELDIKKAINHSYKEDELSVVDLLATNVCCFTIDFADDQREEAIPKGAD